MDRSGATLADLWTVQYWSDGTWCWFTDAGGWVPGMLRSDADWAAGVVEKRRGLSRVVPYSAVEERLRRHVA